jgi:hypothetical protein
LREESWRDRIDTHTRERFTFDHLAEFVTAPPLAGLGADVELVQRLVRGTPAERLLRQALKPGQGRRNMRGDTPEARRRITNNRTRGYVLERLHRERPDLLARVDAGELSAHNAAVQAGELDALKWTDLDFTPGAESIHVQRQWNAKAGKITPPKHGSVGTIAMVEPLRDRLLALPRESEWVFTTLRGHHYVPSTRSHHWAASVAPSGLGPHRSTKPRATTSRGTCSTWPSCPITSWPCNSGTRTAERWCASFTGTRTPRRHGSGSGPGCVTLRRSPRCRCRPRRWRCDPARAARAPFRHVCGSARPSASARGRRVLMASATVRPC